MYNANCVIISRNFVGFPNENGDRKDCIQRDGVYKYIHLSLISNFELSCDPSAGQHRPRLTVTFYIVHVIKRETRHGKEEEKML